MELQEKEKFICRKYLYLGMVASLLYWCKLYDKLKHHSLCLDIETTGYNGEISIIGLYKPKDGPIECESLIKGENLNYENLKRMLVNCRMLITYNGISFDIPKVKKEFPGTIPDGIPVIDLYRFARKLGLNTNLKILENMLAVERIYAFSKKRRIAVKLWKRYVAYNDTQALSMLLEYNKQDTINLYPIAEQLVDMVYEKLGIKETLCWIDK